MLSVELPWSKSILNRAMVMQHLEGRLTAPAADMATVAEDCRVIYRLLRQTESHSDEAFHCGDCGTAARFAAALLAIMPGSHTLDGSPRMRERPMLGLKKALEQMDVTIVSRDADGHLPWRIEGNADMGADTVIDIDSTESSQYASAMLLVAPYLRGGLRCRVTTTEATMSSKPYIEMTIGMMRRCGIETTVTDDGTIVVKQGRYVDPDAVLERDWSAAAYCYEAVAIGAAGSQLLMRGLTINSLQGDRVAAELFEPLGVKTLETPDGIVITRTGSRERLYTRDMSQCPDLVPAVACTCAATSTEAHLQGIRNLRLKESDRVNALTEGLAALGVEAYADDDTLHILPHPMAQGERHSDASIDGRGDHRIIMAFATLGLAMPWVKTERDNATAKSFPTFWQTLDSLYNM